MVEGDSGTFYKGTQIFYVPLGFESWNPTSTDEQQNDSRQILRWGGYSPEPETTCGGSIFNHDNVFHIHPITGQKLLYISYWDAGLRIVDVTNPPEVPDPEGITGHRTMKSVAGLVAQALMTDGTVLTAVAMPTSPLKNGVVARALSTGTAGFTMRFLTTICCATEPKKPTQWKPGTLNVAQVQAMLNLASTGAT